MPIVKEVIYTIDGQPIEVDLRYEPEHKPCYHDPEEWQNFTRCRKCWAILRRFD